MIINYLPCCTRFSATLIGVNSPSFPFSAFAGSSLGHLYPFYSRVYSRRGRLLALIRILNLILSLINSHILLFISFILREHLCQLRLMLEAIFFHVIFVSFSRFLLCGLQFYINFILILHSIIRSFTRHLISCLFYLRERLKNFIGNTSQVKALIELITHLDCVKSFSEVNPLYALANYIHCNQRATLSTFIS